MPVIVSSFDFNCMTVQVGVTRRSACKPGSTLAPEVEGVDIMTETSAGVLWKAIIPWLRWFSTLEVRIGNWETGERPNES